MEFHGLEPWPDRVPLIEVESAGEVLDLHDWAQFVSVAFRAPESLTATFQHQGPDDAAPRLVELRFYPVRHLVVTQAEDFDARVVVDLEHWLWQDAGDGWSRVDFKVGDLVAEFRAQAVELTTSP